jgi:hypothetical protein
MIRSIPRTHLLLLIGLVLASILAALVAPRSAEAAEQTCPSTFHVLHDDRIGKLELPAGHYTVTLLDSEALSCTKASKLFAKFLQDYDGDLPNGWKVIPKKSEFVKSKTGAGFRVERGSKSGGGGGTHPQKGSKLCPGTFEVLHNDSIGDVSFRKGEYTIHRLTKTSPSCERASKLFAKFLEDFDGDLPKRWKLKARTASFVERHSGGDGFRVKPVR